MTNSLRGLFSLGRSVNNALIIEAVWTKGRVIFGYDRNVWRQDDYGGYMRRSDYGNRDSEYGWEIDHIVTIANGGTDDLSNLRPLYWRNNVARNTSLGQIG